MKRYAEYLRKSRADDTHDSVEQVLRKHRELLEEFQRSAGISVAPEDVYEEVVSGDSLYSRPEMLRLLEKVEQGVYQAVLCMDIQRLGRGSMSDQGAILDAFKYSGTKIVTPTKTYDLNDELDETYTEFETFLGRQELRMIKKRLQRGKAKTVQDGGHCANAPYGYERAYLDKKPTLKPVEEEARYIQIMFRCCADQDMSSQEIAEHVNALGARPRRGDRFARSTILRILKNPVYSGKIVWRQESPPHMERETRRPSAPGGGRTEVDGLHPAIIGQELFDRVQARLEERSRPAAGFTGMVENPLAGLVFCARCGAHMQRQSCRGGPLLICPKKSCNVSSRLDAVEKAVFTLLDVHFSGLAFQLQQDTYPLKPDDHLELDSLDAQLKKLARQKKQLYDLVEQSIYDIPTFSFRREELDQRIQELKRVKKSLETQDKTRESAPRVSLLTLSEFLAACAPQEQNRILKCLVNQIVYEKQPGDPPEGFRLTIALKPLRPDCTEEKN